MFSLEGKNALVTGATGGSGEAIARMLHAQGAAVSLSGTRAEKLEALAAELGDRAFVTPANLSDRDAVAALLPAAEEKMGSVDILVNNAGITRDGFFHKMSVDKWRQVIAADLDSVFNMSHGVFGGNFLALLWPCGAQSVGVAHRRHSRRARARVTQARVKRTWKTVPPP